MNLVTGANGLLGSRLVYDLIMQGNQVRALKRPGADLSLVKKYFAGVPGLFNKIEWAEGDVLDVFSIEKALEQVSHVYHCAAMVSFDSSDYDAMMLVNVTGTANVVNLCLEKKITKLCHASSVAAIGRALDNETITEDTQWQTSRHNSTYAISKYGAEREVWRGVAEGLDAVIVNPTIILGRGSWEEGSSSMIRKLHEGLRFYTRGVNGFVDVNDVSSIMIRLMESNIKNERFILHSENLSYYDFFSMAAGFLNKTPPSYLAGPMLSGIAWRLEKLKSMFTGKKPLVTRETARTANNRYFYNSSRIREKLNFSFTPLAKTVERVCLEYLSEKT